MHRIAWIAALSFITAQARADFFPLSESAVFDPATGNVTFTMELSEIPDFFTLNDHGQADAFQYFIWGDPSLPYPAYWDTIIRGDEIHITHDEVRLRNSVPADPDPDAHGWGSLRGSVPYQLDGNVLTFSAPLSMVSDHSIDGHFAYFLETYEFGGMTTHIESQSIVIPEPTSLALLAAGAMLMIRRKR